VHHLAATAPVRQVERDHLDVGKRGSKRRDSGVIRPVAAADEQRALVEPDRVAALCAGMRR
jgi:hypothetical protein